MLKKKLIPGAKASWFNVTGGPTMQPGEIEDAIGMIESESDDNADIIWGNVIREEMGDRIMVTVIATGFDTAVQMSRPQPRVMEAQAAANGAPKTGFVPAPIMAPEEDLEVPTFIRRQAD